MDDGSNRRRGVDRHRETGPSRTRLGRLGDVAIAWAIGLLYIASVLDTSRSAAAVVAAVALGTAAIVALLQRRRRPGPATAAALAVDLVVLRMAPEMAFPFAGFAALWSFTLVRPPRASLVVLAAVLGVVGANVVLTEPTDTVSREDLLFIMAMAVVVWALAEAARNRVEAARQGAERAAAEERVTIARELHDVVAHGVSVIVVQAGAANDVFDRRPDQARAALLAIEDTGRQALRELRRVLGAVRPDDGTAPVPGLDRLDDLVGPLTGAGLEVAIAVDGERRALDAGVELSAYRIVQEALTNTLRHADATRAEVTVRYGTEAVDIEIVDDGRSADGRRSDGSGLGLVGMRERAALHGGQLHAGPTAHGGFRVLAHLPLQVLERR